jgi:L-seryl-tRNA(Ser) seleniumtransferase
MESLLSSPEAAELASKYGREAVKHALRAAISAGNTKATELLGAAARALVRSFEPTLKRAINGTGVLLHTNLGRAPLADRAREAISAVASGYSTLEHDAETGARGRRQDHVRALATQLFGAADALVVNNNAAAVLLALSGLARGSGVLISRGELVAIGGSFKIPEILEASGARLVEVGTTNRTTIEDYRRAVTPDVAMLLTVHPSNYEIRGYTRRPTSAELAGLAAERKIPWVHDQGTGCVVPLEEFGVAGEPTVEHCLSWGASIVTFSGDKLFGGPQAGFLIGEGKLVGTLSAHPLARALRPDKLTLAALAATLSDWITGRWTEFPIYRAAAQTLPILEERGVAIRGAVREGRSKDALSIEVVPSQTLFGGGTSPEKRFPSRALAVRHTGMRADGLAARLRALPEPILGRIEEDLLRLDLRTILPSEDAEVASALSSLAAPGDAIIAK